MMFLQNFDRENDRYKIIKHYKYFLIILLLLYSLANFIIIVFVIYHVNNLVYIIIDLSLLLTISVKHFLDNIYFEQFYNNFYYYIYCTMYNVIYIYVMAIIELLWYLNKLYNHYLGNINKIIH